MTLNESSRVFYDSLCQLIEGTEKIIRSTTHRYAPLHDDAINYVEGAFYSNLIKLYRQNLNARFFKNVKMTKKDSEALLELLRPFFKRAKDTADSTFNKGEVDFHVYQDFRRTIYDFGDDAYWLLLGVERYADVIRCEHRMIQFKNEIASLERER
ncbi:MAG: hypothetical protein JW939_05970 [Candidatus Thermoplasmatota archaeon]|nr:hypothetical protein [Candidatus Thermoplasmatota archaeon]